MKSAKLSPWIATALSFLTIGLGHIYIGAGGRGILLYCVTFMVSYLAILSGSIEQFGISLAMIVTTGICCYAYTVIDVLKLLPHLNGQPKKPYSKWYVYFLIYLINSIFFAPLLSSTFINSMGKTYVVSNVSMAPTILNDEQLLVEQKPERIIVSGDIITFTLPDQPATIYLKRVVGIAGDTVQIKNGALFINDQKIAEPNPQILSPAFEPIIPKGYLFVLGDNTENSFDSRSFGLLAEQGVTGVASKIYWSWDGEKKRVRWERLGVALSESKSDP